MAALRIGLISSEYPGAPPSGGIGTYVRTLARQFADLGQAVFVLLSSQSNRVVTRDGFVWLYGVGGEGLARFPFVPRAKEFGRRLGQIVERLGLDVVEAPEWGGLTAQWGMGRGVRPPVIVRLHTSLAIVQWANRAGMLQRLRWAGRRKLERMAIRTADAISAPSAAVLELTRAQLRLSLPGAHVIPNAVDNGFFRRRWGVAEGFRPTILCVGRLEWRKGPDRLVHAIPEIVRRFPRAQFRFIGEDTRTAPGRSSMRIYMASLLAGPIRECVRFEGAVGHEALPQLFADASVCVFPSRWEAFGIATAEAMACGVPVVVSNSGGFPEFVTHAESGLVVDCDKPLELAAAVVRILSDARLAAKLGENARGVAEQRFQAGTVAERTLELYRQLIWTSGRVRSDSR